MIDYKSLTIRSGIVSILLGVATIAASFFDYELPIKTAPEVLIILGFTAIGGRRAVQKLEDRL